MTATMATAAEAMAATAASETVATAAAEGARSAAAASETARRAAAETTRATARLGRIGSGRATGERLITSRGVLRRGIPETLIALRSGTVPILAATGAALESAPAIEVAPVCAVRLSGESATHTCGAGSRSRPKPLRKPRVGVPHA